MGLVYIDYKLNLLIIKNKARLEKLIRENAPYDKVLKESKRLDKLIEQQIKEINSKQD